MKQCTYFIFCLITFNYSFGQAVTLQPNFFQLPRLAVNPSCTVPDKGKMIFNTNLNKILYCNGSIWIDPETGVGARITPAFSARNVSGQVLTSNAEVIKFPNQDFDLSNSFNLNSASTLPNTFIAPDNGIYEFVLNAKMDLSNFVPLFNTRIRIGIAWSQEGSTNVLYYEFPVYDDSNQNLIQISKALKVAAGRRVYFLVMLLNGPTYGTLRMDEIYLSGKLVSWY